MKVMGVVEMTPNRHVVVVVEYYCLLVNSLRSLTVMLLVMVSWKVNLLCVHFLYNTRAKNLKKIDVKLRLGNILPYFYTTIFLRGNSR